MDNQSKPERSVTHTYQSEKNTESKSVEGCVLLPCECHLSSDDRMSLVRRRLQVEFRFGLCAGTSREGEETGTGKDADVILAGLSILRSLSRHS